MDLLWLFRYDKPQKINPIPVWNKIKCTPYKSRHYDIGRHLPTVDIPAPYFKCIINIYLSLYTDSCLMISIDTKNFDSQVNRGAQ